MAVKKKQSTTKPAAKKVSTKAIIQQAKNVAADAQRAQDLASGKAEPKKPEPTSQPQPTKTAPKKRVSSAAQNADKVKEEMLKPALLAKQKKDAEIRSEQLKETGLVVIEPADAKIPLKPEIASALAAEGLMEYEVEGTSVRLIGLADPNATPTLAQRLAIARRLIEADGKLPKYVKTIKAKQPEFDNAVKEAAVKPAAAPRAASSAASSIPNGVPLKKVCAGINIEPKLARRILRSKGAKPGGRWEWPEAEVANVQKMLKDEADKLAKQEEKK